MPWTRVSVMEERIRFVIRASCEGVNMSRLCREFGISRPTGYLWLKRYHDSGSVIGVIERSRRPLRSPNHTSSADEALVIRLRRQYGWGAGKLRELLRRDGISIAVSTINRILKRNGLVRPKDSHRPAAKRFEREHPNQLWQMDFKGDCRLNHGVCYPLSILDDHSRYAVGLYALPNQLGSTVHTSLVETFEHYGVPEAMLMDHGIPWWANSNRHGLTRLSVSLIKQGIKLCFGAFRHPQTQGKVERFHRTLEDRFWHRGKPKTLAGFRRTLAEFREEYNQIRPHEALGMAVPAERYQPSPKAYNPQPPDWEYPEGAIVKRLNTQGCLDYNRKRYFVCEAIADELVQIENIEDKIVVRYRHVYIREIERKTGKSVSLLKPV